MEACQVLIVDDNTSLAETIAGLLADEGFETETVSTGVEALAAWRRHPAQLVIVDVDLPDIEGIRVARRLARRAQCGLLMMSAREPSQVLPVCREIGAAFLAKPFPSSRLLAAVRGALEKLRRAQRAQAASPRQLEGPRLPRALLEHPAPRRRSAR